MALAEKLRARATKNSDETSRAACYAHTNLHVMPTHVAVALLVGTVIFSENCVRLASATASRVNAKRELANIFFLSLFV
jgi:hypothetical protein